MLRGHRSAWRGRNESGRAIRGFFVSLIRLTVMFAVFVVGSANADDQTRMRDLGPLLESERTDSASEPARDVYIVQMKTPSAATIHGRMNPSVTGTAKPGLRTRGRKFNKNSAAIQNHVRRIRDEQREVIDKAGSGLQTIYDYQYGLNGFAAQMTELEASKFERMPEVLRVWKDEVRPLTTNFSADFLDLFAENVGLRGTPGLDGEGIVIGVIDSGIAPEHPALQDTREADRPRACRSTWAEASLLGRWLCKRYDRLEDVVEFEPPEDWNGICQVGPQFTDENCNNKVIGARFFIDGALATGAIDSGEIQSPRDVDGHGTHTATTAAGNRVDASIFGTTLGRVEGMAPKARVAVYKACWLRPGATRASCNTSDLANAIDMAVADGVDIINYSVGSTLFTVTAADDIALLAATKAGVLTVVAAGNDGPNFDTIMSPASSPAVITAAASSRDGQHSLEAMRVDSPPGIAGEYAVREAAFTPALADNDPLEGQLVLADDDDNTTDDGTTGATFDGCQSFINSSEVSGNIAFMQRGGCTFDVKIQNADNAGAIAAIVFNVSGPPIVMQGSSNLSDIPALMVGAADGNLMLDEINNDEIVEVTLDKGLFLTVADDGNVMGTFSSRGPGVAPDILKPDVTAPGVNILAGSTPDIANGISGENFQFLTGTSMSAPHIAGIAALIKQAHPDWSPAAIKSALLTTARQDVLHSDGTSDAIPFDFGSGHIVPNNANDPGLVYDIDEDGYDAFSCAADFPDVAQSRCDELETAGVSFDPAQMNQPNISVSRLTSVATITRTVTSVTDSAETYSAEIEMPPGIGVQVTPSSLTVGPGQSASFDVTLTYESGPLDIYRFGSLTWVSNNHRVRSVITARPLSLDAPAEIITSGGSGNLAFPVEFGYDGSYTPVVHGLRSSLIDADISIPEDTSKTFSQRNVNGVQEFVFNVPSDQLALRFALFDELTDGDDDLDMYLYYCAPGLDCNFRDNYTQIGQSGEATSREQIDVLLPAAGTYAVYVHAFETDNVAGGPGAVYTLQSWQIGITDDVGNMTASGPVNVTAGTTDDITIDWNGLGAGLHYLGAISHNTPDGLVGVTLINIAN